MPPMSTTWLKSGVPEEAQARMTDDRPVCPGGNVAETTLSETAAIARPGVALSRDALFSEPVP